MIIQFFSARSIGGSDIVYGGTGFGVFEVKSVCQIAAVIEQSYTEILKSGKTYQAVLQNRRFLFDPVYKDLIVVLFRTFQMNGQGIDHRAFSGYKDFRTVIVPSRKISFRLPQPDHDPAGYRRRIFHQKFKVRQTSRRKPEGTSQGDLCPRHPDGTCQIPEKKSCTQDQKTKLFHCLNSS